MKPMRGTRMEGYFGETEVATTLGVTRQAIHKLIMSGEIAPVRYVENFYLVPQETIDAFLAARHSANITDRRYKII